MRASEASYYRLSDFVGLLVCVGSFEPYWGGCTVTVGTSDRVCVGNPAQCAGCEGTDVGEEVSQQVTPLEVAFLDTKSIVAT